ncbi:hypothetical protein [Paludisphaera soli]|uniref:hypothetical protein n=1 Tax=Paludisphaera soli TaxID=2712865 RepID=UPI0013EB1DD1|nr:hypothetical protein [Paludisphaera soli]
MPFDFQPAPIFAGAGLATPHAPALAVPDSSRIDGLRWNCLMGLDVYDDDVDGYRARYGKAEGERRFFRERRPIERKTVRGNMLLIGGASNLWQYALGNGTTTSGQALTYLNSTQTHIAVGDGGPTALTGTASVTNGSATVTASTSQSGLIGKFLQFAGDSTAGVYKVTAGSGTSWTISPVYGGATASGISYTQITAEADGQTDLIASTNKVRQVVDAGFPAHSTGTTGQAVTAATNATPIVVTCTNSYAEGDFVLIQGVLGNTAANGLWRVVSVSGTAFTLEGSAGNGAYTSGGVASKSRVLVAQATFGTGAGNFAWNEWGVANAASGGTLINRKVAGLGTKTSAASWTFKVALGLGDRT